MISLIIILFVGLFNTSLIMLSATWHITASEACWNSQTYGSRTMVSKGTFALICWRHMTGLRPFIKSFLKIDGVQSQSRSLYWRVLFKIRRNLLMNRTLSTASSEISMTTLLRSSIPKTIATGYMETSGLWLDTWLTRAFQTAFWSMFLSS